MTKKTWRIYENNILFGLFGITLSLLIMDRNEILNKMQEEVRFLQEAFEKYRSEFDAETLIPISEQLSVLNQNILEIDKELRRLKHLTDNPQIKVDQI
jgi:aromatic ring-opening dioxygenase LigB subunit